MHSEDDDPIYNDKGQAYLDRDEVRALTDANEGAEVEPADEHYPTTDGAVKEAGRYKNDGAILHDVTDDGGGYYGAFKPGLVKSADYNACSYSVSSRDLYLSPARPPWSRRQGS